MKIGIDIDGVLTDYKQFAVDFVTKFCYENGIPINVKLDEYTDTESFNLTYEQATKFWNEYFAGYARGAKTRMFAKEVIDKLREEHEIYIITARNEEGLPEELHGKIQELTKEFLQYNNIVYDKIFFTGGSKLKTIVDNNVDIMIEDAPDNIQELSKKIQILCYNTQYNEEIEGENITRVYSWYDIYEKIKGRQAKL